MCNNNFKEGLKGKGLDGESYPTPETLRAANRIYKKNSLNPLQIQNRPSTSPSPGKINWFASSPSLDRSHKGMCLIVLTSIGFLIREKLTDGRHTPKARGRTDGLQDGLLDHLGRESADDVHIGLLFTGRKGKNRVAVVHRVRRADCTEVCGRTGR